MTLIPEKQIPFGGFRHESAGGSGTYVMKQHDKNMKYFLSLKSEKGDLCCATHGSSCSINGRHFQ